MGAMDAKVGVDTAANEPRKGSEILKKQNDIASNNGIIDEKKLTIKTIDEQIALSAGEKRKLNETRINEKAELIKFFDDQIKLNSVEVAEIFLQKWRIKNKCSAC